MFSRLKRLRVSVGLFAGLLFVCGVLWVAHAYSQVAGAALSGLITDEQGGPVASATVATRNIATGVVREAVSNSEGFFSAPNLLPGSYEMTITAQGFQKFVQKEITLTVGGSQALNVTLKVGSLVESVEVNAAPPAIQTTSSAISNIVDSTTVRELPLNGRDWTQLATLEPGVISQPAQASTTASNNRGNRGFGNQLSVSGHRPYENTYRVNGININDYSNGAPGSVLGVNLGVDAIQEFSVLTTNYTAEYGRTSGAVINAITKSGTNQLHGSAYFFDRDKIYDARNFFDKAKPPFRRIQFGAAAGGPVIKDRTFLFGDYEGIRQSKGVTQSNTVLSDAARQGNLSTGTVSVDPNVARYLALMPRVNAGLTASGDTGSFSFASQSIITENYGSLRVDHKLSNTDSLAGSYFIDSAPFTQPDPWDNFLTGIFTRRQAVTLEETHTFSSQLANSVRVGYSRVLGIVNRSSIPITAAAKDTSLAAVPGLFAPLISVPGITPSDAGGGLGSLSSFSHTWNSYQANDDVFLVRRTHSLKFGFAFEAMQYNLLGALRADGEFFFDSLADFLTNRARQVQLRDPRTSAETGSRQKLFAGYLQDDWRVRSRLTLNFGLRYEMVTLPSEAHDGFQVVTDLFGGSVHPVKNLWASNPTLRNVEPRVGFAWDPFGNSKTAVRGAFGIFDVLPLPYTYTQYNSSSFPFSTTASSTSSAALAGTFGTANAFKVVSFNPANLVSRFFEQDPRRSYVMNWNLNVQREITPTLSSMVGYVGSHSVHLSFTADDINIVLPSTVSSAGFFWPTPINSGTKLNPNAGPLRPLLFDGDATYHALQARLKKAMSHGLQAEGSYTWSRCMDSGSTGTVGDVFLNSIRALPFFSKALRRGPCDFGIQHTFVGNYIWNLPSPRVPSAFVSRALGGWQVGGIIAASSGMPFTVVMGGDPLGYKSLDPLDFVDRLNVPGCENPVNPGSVGYLKLACFAAPRPQNRMGNFGRNHVVGPGLFNVDFSVFKNTAVRRISESFHVQFRAEFFNVLNRANLQAPLDNNRLFNPDGSPIGGAGQIKATVTDARQIQFGLKLVW